MRGDNGTPETPDWHCEPHSVPDELWIDRDGPDGWMVRFPAPAVINRLAWERHRDNCTLVDCRICTPPNVSRGEN